MTTKPLPILSLGQIWSAAIFIGSVTGLPVALFCDAHPWVIASPILLGVVLILAGEISSERQMAANQNSAPALEHTRTSYPAVQFNTPLWKRGFDVLIILLATPVFLPLGLIIATIVRATSKGPILYKQIRIGYKGQSFFIYRFRIWYLIEETLPRGGIAYHHELTRIGKLIRLSGLDTLPQLVNVLRGEMSLVGPIPCSPINVDKYLPWQKERFDTPPGLTGLWQVSGKNATTLNQMIHLDIEYVRHRSFWLDAKLILLTIPALFVQIRTMRMASSNRNDTEDETLRKLVPI